jgi:predicted NUDIX family phosphoesterase
MPSKLNGQEQVLCIPRASMDSILGPTVVGRPARFLDESQVCGKDLEDAIRFTTFRARTADLERDPSWLQLIPYGMLIWSGKAFLYERPIGGDKRLEKRYSLGVGGHVNPQDVEPGMKIQDLHRALFRELIEEMRPDSQSLGDTVLVGLIHDASNEVGSVHLGLAFTVQVRSPVNLNPDPTAIIPRGWFDRERLASLESAYKDRLESWSQACRPWLAESPVSPLVAQAKFLAHAE